MLPSGVEPSVRDMIVRHISMIDMQLEMKTLTKEKVQNARAAAQEYITPAQRKRLLRLCELNSIPGFRAAAYVVLTDDSLDSVRFRSVLGTQVSIAP